jgi:hypothetical protein
MSNEDVPGRRRRTRYTPEYKADAVSRVTCRNAVTFATDMSG